MSRRNKFLSETKALSKLADLREEFRQRIKDTFEYRAKPCSNCPKFGACCTDEHFVNVRISTLEAVAITRSLEQLSAEHRQRVYRRVEEAVTGYRLETEHDATYSCPLFEPGFGCLVHSTAKPLPCIQHACYERQDDLPPDELLEAAELAVDKLDRNVYGRMCVPLPLPVALRKATS